MKQARRHVARRLLCLGLAILLLAAFAPQAFAGTDWYNTHPGWVATHSDKHFDITWEPDRPMTVEEFVALTTAYSWYVTGDTAGTYPLPRDKNGDLPSDWAAPYIRYYAASKAFDPERVDYDAPATVGFMMMFFARLRGKYSFDAVNVHYRFAGTENYTPEEKLLLCAAIDYGIVPYTPGMDVSRADLLRKDLETKYVIPAAQSTPAAPVQLSKSYRYSLVFFEDTYHYFDALKESSARPQLENIMAAGDAINMVNLNVLPFNQNGSAGHFVAEDRVGMKETHLELLSYCKENGIKTLCGVANYYNDTALSALKNDPSKISAAADELVGYVMAYDFDGLDMDLELYGNAYRDTYSALLRALAGRLHAKGKLLVATVGAYFDSATEAASLYDYSVLRDACDIVTVILYDDHPARTYDNGGGSVGCVSNYQGIPWRIAYAVTVLGAEKTMLSVATYGVDFNTREHRATNLLRQEIDALLAKTGATVQTHADKTDDSYFTYTDASGNPHEVYYERDEAIFRRLDLAARYGLIGVCAYYALSDTPAVYARMGARLNELPFQDIEHTWYYEPVKWAVANGVTSGTSATAFSPDKTCTRGQVVTFLWRAKGSPEPESTENPFTDVQTTDYFYKAVLWAKENGITSGTSATQFSPNRGCTRGQVVTFLWRTEGEPEPSATDNPFDDVAQDDYYYRAVLWAVENGITNGTGANKFSPVQTCTRAQVVTFLYRDLG